MQNLKIGNSNYALRYTVSELESFERTLGNVIDRLGRSRNYLTQAEGELRIVKDQGWTSGSYLHDRASAWVVHLHAEVGRLDADADELRAVIAHIESHGVKV